MKDSENSSYKGIVKNTTLFGGVQIVQILTTLLKGKAIAILLGATGIGINTLLTSATNIIIQICSFGINFSGVREISMAKNSGDDFGLTRIINILRTVIYFCALVGGIVTLTGSYFLSYLTFGDNTFVYGYIWLSIAVSLNILASLNITILQGMQRLREMAKATLLGAIVSLLASLPLYYFFGQDSIAPSLVLSALISYCFSKFQVTKAVNISNINLKVKEAFLGATEMAKLGGAMMAATLIGSVVTYIVNAYISRYGSLVEVGLYGAGISITNQYVGIVFTAMAADYFPRLSAVSGDKTKVNSIVNQQGEIVILIITPLLITMMITAPILIKLLLTSEFLSIRNFVCWVSFALLFKAAGFALGYISFAKGDKKVFFLFEGVMGSILILTCNIVGYSLNGLVGIGISIVVSYVVYLIAVVILTFRKYEFKIENKFAKIFFYSLILMSIVLIAVLNIQNIYGYTFATITLVVSLTYSLKELDQRIGLKSVIYNRFKSFRKN
ncbi:MAG: O-antigen translocase [Pedobacter sp.]|nr:MAG: O-antigen translocase [Pedobacter sp.]